MTSRAKTISNRRNARLSTGPSEESRPGRGSTVCTLGLRAKSRLLPGETEEDFSEVKETWVKSLHPRDPAECTLVSDIIMADWFCRRAERSHFKHVNAYIAGASNSEAIRVASDIRQLFHDNASGHLATYGVSSFCCGGPRTSIPDKPEAPLHRRTWSAALKAVLKVARPCSRAGRR